MNSQLVVTELTSEEPDKWLKNSLSLKSWKGHGLFQACVACEKGREWRVVGRLGELRYSDWIESACDGTFFSGSAVQIYGQQSFCNAIYQLD